MKRLIAILICITVSYSLFAVGLNKQYQSQDHSFKLSVPDDWSVTEENKGFVCLSQNVASGDEDYHPQLFVEAIETEVESSSLDLDSIIEDAMAAYPEILLNQGYLDTKVTRNGHVEVNNRVYQSLLMSCMYEQDEVKVLQYITIDKSSVYILSFFVKSSGYSANDTLFTEILHSFTIEQ